MSQLNVDKVVSLSGGGSTAEFQLASNGNFNFDSGTFYIDSVNNRVGLGTTTPRVSLDIANTDSMIVPVGTTVQRPGSAVEGMFRYNTSDRTFEGNAHKAEELSHLSKEQKEDIDLVHLGIMLTEQFMLQTHQQT